MALRPQTYADIQDMLAAGMVRVGTAGELYAPDGTLLNSAAQVSRVAASPTTGQTVNANANAQNQQIYLTPAGTIAALTVNVPADNVSVVGQQIQVTTSQTITALTLGGATTFLGNVTTLAGGATIVLTKQAANTWSVK